MADLVLVHALTKFQIVSDDSSSIYHSMSICELLFVLLAICHYNSHLIDALYFGSIIKTSYDMSVKNDFSKT